MLTVTLFTIAKMWNKPKDDVVHIYNGILLLSHKKEQNNAIFSNMGEPRDCHIERGKADKDNDCLYVEFLKIAQTNFFYKRERVTDVENKLVSGGRGRDKLGEWN